MTLGHAPMPRRAEAIAAPSSTPPTISVITVCRNAATTIEKTLRSLAAQRYPHVQSVIVDGVSTDGTLDIVARYATAATTVLSEPDAGIYDAMNKGIRLATGDVLYFLNADDSFVDENVLGDIAQVFASDPTRLFVFGNVVYEGAPDGQVFGPAQPFRTFTVHEFLHKPFCHQAVFAHRRLFDALGGFDTRHRYVADYAWYTQVFKTFPDAMHAVDRDIAHYFYNGRSRIDDATTRHEKRDVQRAELRSPAMLWYDFRYTVLRGWKKRLLGEPW